MEERALAILREFVQDVDAVGIRNMKEDWPDLLVTYTKAKKLLRQAKAASVEVLVVG